MYMAKGNGRNRCYEGSRQTFVDANFNKAKLVSKSKNHSKLEIHNRLFRNRNN